jgi:hypothetical protein
MSDPEIIARRRSQDQTAGCSEQPDELISIVKDSHGEILDAEIDEFFKMERKASNRVVLTLIGKDETKPYKIVMESDSKISIRPFGVKLES